MSSMKCRANLHVATDAAAVGDSGVVWLPFVFENRLPTSLEASLSNFSQSMKVPVRWLCIRTRRNINHNSVVFNESRIWFLSDEEALARVTFSLWYDMIWYDLTAWIQKEALQLEEGNWTAASVLTAPLLALIRIPFFHFYFSAEDRDFLIGAIRSSLYTMTPSAK